MSQISASWMGAFESMRDYKNIPPDTLQGILDYVIDGRSGGDFLRAVFENNLAKAYAHGDLRNLVALWAIVTFMVNRVPKDCWGDLLTRMNWPGLRKFMSGIVIPAEAVEKVVAEWKAEAIKGTVLEQ